VLNEREALLKKSLREMKIQENLRNFFLQAARRETSFSFDLILTGGPAFEGESPDYRAQKENGIDTIHEMTVQQFGWTGDGSVPLNLALYMEVRVRLISTLKNREIFSKSYHYESNRRKVSDWIDTDGKVSRDEFLNCYQFLAENIMKDIYLLDSFIPY
jgi:hypothetical protein